MTHPLHGWLVVDKPLGLGSTQAVSAIKRILRQSGHPKARVGHGGTLDPLATGVLPIAIGEATKLAGRMLDADKAYDFTIRFGTETTTLDAEGEASAESPHRPTPADLEAVLPHFTGAIAQMPPVYSALKVEGRRAYDLARAGEAVKLAERHVTIHELDILSAANGSLDEATLSARVSKGTYIRSLARDLARALGTVGHVAMLRRTRAGGFGLADAHGLDFLEEVAMQGRLREFLLPVGHGLADIPVFALLPDQAQALRQGRRLGRDAALPGIALATFQNVPVALVDVAEDGIRVVRGFNLMSE